MDNTTRFVSISNKGDITHKFEKFVRNVSENTPINKDQMRAAALNAVNTWERSNNQKITAIYEMGERKKQRNIKRLARLITQPNLSSDLPTGDQEDLRIIAFLELENMFRDKPSLIF
jgi:hypothetical protein